MALVARTRRRARIRFAETLPRLGEFIFPGHSEAGCRLHIARAIARRVERHLVRLPKQSIAIALPYVNRLSDLLFKSLNALSQ